MTDEEQELVHRLMRRSESFQGRVASPEQIQVNIDFPQHQGWVDMFKDWWLHGFRYWRKRHQDDANARMVFISELGPPPYAITGADGFELSDRWQEALTIRGWVESIWTDLDNEFG